MLSMQLNLQRAKIKPRLLKSWIMQVYSMSLKLLDEKRDEDRRSHVISQEPD